VLHPTLDAMVRRLTPLAIVLALLAALPGAAGASGAVGEPCPGARLDVSVHSDALPRGQRSVEGGCLLPVAHYEVEVAGYRLVLGLAEVDYREGGRGRLAVGTLSLPDGAAATLVGTEDAATGSVRWVYVEGDHAGAPAATTWRGEGIADVADAPATAVVSIRGRGADLMTAPGPVAAEVRALVLGAISTLG